MLPAGMFAVLYCAAVHCSRISEILNLTPNDYLGENRFLVHGLKRSRNYIVRLPVVVLDPRWRSSPRASEPFIDFSYRQLWRTCRRAGIGITPPGHRNCAVTHGHRYLTAGKVRAASDSIAAGDALHHNSRRSVSYYL